MNDHKVPCGTVSAYDKQCDSEQLCAACKEITQLRDRVRELEGLKLFVNLQQIGHFADAMAQTRALLSGAEADDIARSVARGRLAALVRDITETVIPTSDPKFVVKGGIICNAKTNEPIPDDEPIMIFRAKDALAAKTIFDYGMNFQPGTPHRVAIDNQHMAFVDFSHAHPDRMKQPDT